eukprot:8107530-Heterocapsa_arctica.AAC.1
MPRRPAGVVYKFPLPYPTRGSRDEGCLDGPAGITRATVQTSRALPRDSRSLVIYSDYNLRLCRDLHVV